MAFDVTGKLVAKFDTVQRTETFRTREFVVEVSDTVGERVISNYVKFQCVQDRTSMVDRFNIGDTVKVHFNLRGSRWEKNGQVNYITNLDAWRMEQAGSMQAAPAPVSTPGISAGAPSQDMADDLPF